MKPLGSRKPSLYGSVSEDWASLGASTTISWRSTCIPVLVVAFCAALSSGGPTYAFAMYSKTLKETLQLSQSSLDTISSANFCAGIVSFLPGAAVDRFGIRVSMTIGGLCMSVAFVFYWLIASLYIQVDRIVLVLCLLGIVIFVSNSLIVGSIFKGLVVVTGHGSRGSAVGAAKGYVGIGSGVYAIIFKSLPTHSDLDFTLLAATFCLCFIASPAFFLLPTRQTTRNHLIVDVTTSTHFRVVYTGLAVLIGLVLWSSLNFMLRPNPDVVDDPRSWKAGMVLLMWLVPIVSLFFIQRRTVPEQSSFYDPIPDIESENAEIDRDIPLRIHLKDRTLQQMLQTRSAWLFLWTTTILVGSGTMMTNNMAQMVQSRGFSSDASANCLALFSVAQAVARIGVGEVSERALLWNTKWFGIACGVPRTVFVILASMLAILGHGVLAVALTRPVFVVGVVLSGAAFGSVWPLLVLIVADLFGTSSHGSNYMFYDGFTSAFGTLLISKYIVQGVYEEHIDPQVDTINCYGTECFRGSQMIVTALCLSCFVTSILLFHGTRESYGQPIRYCFFGNR